MPPGKKPGKSAYQRNRPFPARLIATAAAPPYSPRQNGADGPL